MKTRSILGLYGSRPATAGGTAVVASLAALVPAVHAQDAELAALDAEINASQTPEGAINLARQQAQQGDLTAAAATLERALLADPNAHDARLFYAGLMCRLDDPQGARVEVSKLAGQAFSDGMWTETYTACGGSLARPPAPASGGRTGLKGELAVGLAFDSDALGPLVTQLDLPVVGVRRDEGLSWTASARFSGKGDHYYDKGDFYGSFSLRSKRSIDGPLQQYDLGEIRAGFGRQAEGADFAIGVVARHARLFDDPYVSEYGVQAEMGLAAKADSRVVLRAEVVQQDYERIGPAANGSGIRAEASVAWEKKLGEDSWVTLGVGGETKDGQVKDFGYNAARVFAGYRQAVGDKGAYFNLAATVRYVDFKNRAPAQDRKDTRAFARAAYGVPVIGDDVILEGAVSYTMRSVSDSRTAPAVPLVNIANYRSAGAEMRLIWKF